VAKEKDMTRLARVALLLVVTAGCASSTPVTSLELVPRGVRFLAGDYEKRLGGPLAEVEVVPFESLIPGTAKWTAADIACAGQQISFPTKILAEFPKGWLLMVTVSGAADDDALARNVLAGLETTGDPDCYWPLYRQKAKTAGVESTSTEDRVRRAAAMGKPVELVLREKLEIFPGVRVADWTIIMNNDASRLCYKYQISGTRTAGDEPSIYRSVGGSAEVGVVFLSPLDLQRLGY
jgi:hypothetical protein